MNDKEWNERVMRRARGYLLAGRNFERADLRGKDLRNVNFTCSNFRGADLTDSDLRGAQLVSADLSRACLLRCNLEGANLCGADMSNCYCKGANFSTAKMWHTVLKGAICKNARFFETDMVGADIARADMLGARFDGAITEGMRNVDRAIFRWFMPPGGGKPIYDPYPGALVLTESLLGSWSWQENAGMGQSGLGYDRTEE
jgi:uncharacterized protein YjbI with pentapeptide repeats